MNNDIISREALLHELGKLSLAWEYGQGVIDCVRLVELAPAVETSIELKNITEEEKQQFFLMWQRATGKGLFVTEPERTQGEWNYIQAGMAVCPFCGATPHKQYKNFCANCGADMRQPNKSVN